MDKRPEINEFIPYYGRYIDLVPEGDIEQILTAQIKDTVQLLIGLTEEQAHFQYGPDKWSMKEVIGHITDTERIMSYRLLCFARGEKKDLPGYDDNDYVQEASFNRLSMEELLEHLKAVRHSTILLLKSLDNDAWERKGIANSSGISVRALAWLLAGHELHHRKLIEERYMGSEEYPSK